MANTNNRSKQKEGGRDEWMEVMFPRVRLIVDSGACILNPAAEIKSTDSLDRTVP